MAGLFVARHKTVARWRCRGSVSCDVLYLYFGLWTLVSLASMYSSEDEDLARFGSLLDASRKTHAFQEQLPSVCKTPLQESPRLSI